MIYSGTAVPGPPGDSKAYRYEVAGEYGPGPAPGAKAADLQTPTTELRTVDHTSIAPDWLVMVVPLGRPVTWSRKTLHSMGDVVEGAFTRREDPVLLADHVMHLQIANSKRSHTKSLQAEIKGIDCLDSDVMLPGDWVLAWMWNNAEDRKRVVDAIKKGLPANDFRDGLKFVGRLHGVRRHRRVDPSTGTKTQTYSVQAVGFRELDTLLFYDTALAGAHYKQGEIAQFMAQIGLDFNQLLGAGIKSAGDVKDNVDQLVPAMINLVLGKGVDDEANAGNRRGTASASAGDQTQKDLIPAPQAPAEAPGAYLVPRLVGQVLGRKPAEASKDDRVFGYADILDAVIGCQSYTADSGFQPEFDNGRTTVSRKFCKRKLKGTFLPVNLSFINQPLWGILTSYLNAEINEMYTAMRTNSEGKVVPTLVARQIPFSTESLGEVADFPLTRFMSLPRWVLASDIVSDSDVGRSEATRCNFVHVYGAAIDYAKNKSLTNQMSRNPPLFDKTDIQRSGIYPRMGTVQCALSDVSDADQQKAWLAAIADWSFGSHLTVNGSLHMVGVQAPICEGDNAEFEGIVYHIESVHHTCMVDPSTGRKSFRTSLEVSNGMPADQRGRTADIPVYAGFVNSPSTVERTDEPSAFASVGVDIVDITSDVRDSLPAKSPAERTDVVSAEGFWDTGAPGTSAT